MELITLFSSVSPTFIFFFTHHTYYFRESLLFQFHIFNVIDIDFEGRNMLEIYSIPRIFTKKMCKL